MAFIDERINSFEKVDGYLGADGNIEVSADEEIFHLKHMMDMKTKEILHAEMKQKEKELLQLGYEKQCKLHCQLYCIDDVQSRKKIRRYKIMLEELMESKLDKLQAKIIECQKYQNCLLQLCALSVNGLSVNP